MYLTVTSGLGWGTVLTFSYNFDFIIELDIFKPVKFDETLTWLSNSAFVICGMCAVFRHLTFEERFRSAFTGVILYGDKIGGDGLLFLGLETGTIETSGLKY